MLTITIAQTTHNTVKMLLMLANVYLPEKKLANVRRNSEHNDDQTIQKKP